LLNYISKFIKKFKDSILAKVSHKELKSKYDHIRKCIQIIMSNHSNNQEQKFINERKATQEVFNFCQDYKKQIANLIYELNIVYKSIVKSGSILDVIFKTPQEKIQNDYNLDFDVSTQQLHKDEFFNAIINDDFIKALIIEVKTKDLDCFIDLRSIIKNIEEDINNIQRDTTEIKEIYKKKHQKRISFIEQFAEKDFNILEEMSIKTGITPKLSNNTLLSVDSLDNNICLNGHGKLMEEVVISQNTSHNISQVKVK
jgi:hypothetical protein